MNAYENAAQKFKVDYFLRAVLQDGSFGGAAKAIGVHRNTITRVLRRAGFPAKRVRQMRRSHERVRAERRGA